MNHILRIFAVAAAVVASSSATCLSGAEPHLALDFSVNVEQQSHPSGSVAGTLIIKNTGDEPVTVEHPHNRMAVAFILLDPLGNVVSPVGIAKVDPRFQEITIQPHSEYKHPFSRLEFLTGSALFGHTLKPKVTYRLIAIYRPRGEKGTGIASPEHTVSVK